MLFSKPPPLPLSCRRLHSPAVPVPIQSQTNIAPRPLTPPAPCSMTRRKILSGDASGTSRGSLPCKQPGNAKEAGCTSPDQSSNGAFRRPDRTQQAPSLARRVTAADRSPCVAKRQLCPHASVSGCGPLGGEHLVRTIHTPHRSLRLHSSQPIAQPQSERVA